MKKYLVISTYPDGGSQNIGDQLITNSLIEAVRRVKGQEVEIDTIWRAASWRDVKEKLDKVDAVIFACLAIRPRMTEFEYPTLRQIVDSGKPIGVISAGTSLGVEASAKNRNMFGLSDDTISVLREIDKTALFFTSRGYLTQRVCMKLGLNRSVFSGDIAFYNESFSRSSFVYLENVKHIAISDPHRAHNYIGVLAMLVAGLKEMFPLAEVDILQHGVNPEVERFANSAGIALRPVFKDRDRGLDWYSKYDLHAGFRVHAHVSALTRRIPSYLLEQDGRGCDYGLTMSRKISVSCHEDISFYTRMYSLASHLMGKKPRKNVSTMSIVQLLSIIEQDADNHFVKFVGMESELEIFNRLALSALNKLP